MNRNTYKIVEVFYGDKTIYRVVEEKPGGEIKTVAKVPSREKAQYYIKCRQATAPEHNQW